MAIAKSTEAQEEPRVFQPHVTEGISSVPTVSWDIIRFFNVDMNQLNKGSNEEQLKEIEGWTFKDAESLGDGLMRLKRLDIQLGTPQDGESRISRVYSWIKMEKAIEDLKLRQRAL
jgi:hypothetical protein